LLSDGAHGIFQGYEGKGCVCNLDDFVEGVGEMAEDFDILKKKDLMASGFYGALGEIVGSMVRAKDGFSIDYPPHQAAVRNSIRLVADTLLKVKPLTDEEKEEIITTFPPPPSAPKKPGLPTSTGFSLP
jgi:hypothetical protein